MKSSQNEVNHQEIIKKLNHKKITNHPERVAKVKKIYQLL